MAYSTLDEKQHFLKQDKSFDKCLFTSFLMPPLSVLIARFFASSAPLLPGRPAATAASSLPLLVVLVLSAAAILPLPAARALAASSAVPLAVMVVAAAVVVPVRVPVVAMVVPVVPVVPRLPAKQHK